MARPGLPSGRVVLLLVLTALGLMTIDARGFGPLDQIRSTAFAATSPLRDAARFVVSPVSDTFHGAVHYDELRAENAELRARVAELEGTVEQLPDVEGQLAELATASGVSFAGDREVVLAEVVTDRRTGLERLIEIDRGSDHGIEVGDPVVTGRGLVGRVEVVSGGRSVVRLITDPAVAVGIRSIANGAIGVAAGDGEGRFLVLDLAEAGRDRVAEGDRFVTAGANGSDLPLGIPVGQARFDDSPTPRLEPLVDLELLLYVSVILLEDPEPATAGAVPGDGGEGEGS